MPADETQSKPPQPEVPTPGEYESHTTAGGSPGTGTGAPEIPATPREQAPGPAGDPDAPPMVVPPVEAPKEAPGAGPGGAPPARPS